GIRDFHVTGVQTCALPIEDAAPGNYAVTEFQTATEFTIVSGMVTDTIPGSDVSVRIDTAGSSTTDLIHYPKRGDTSASATVNLFGTETATATLPSSWTPGVPHVVATTLGGGRLAVRDMLGSDSVSASGLPTKHERFVIAAATIDIVAVYDRTLTDWELLTVMRYVRTSLTLAGGSSAASDRWPIRNWSSRRH